MQGQGNRAADGCRDVFGHGQAFVQPRQQAAVEVVVAAMANDIQQPDETPGPAATFIVVDHVDRVRVMPQFAEQRLERVLRWSWMQRGGL